LVLLLSRSDLEQVLTMPEMISALEGAFKDLAQGKTMKIPRSSMSLPQEGGWIGIMPAYLPTENAFATKLVTLYNGNLDKGLPAIMATVVLNDPKTGAVLSIMDGGLITAMRTGGLGGLAAKFLSRTDSHVAGIFGAGVQARTQLKALMEVRKIDRAFVYDTVTNRVKKFCEEMSNVLQIPVEVAETPSSVVKNSDIITTVTPSGKPVFDGKEIRPGTHVNAFGNYKPVERELDTETVVRSKVFVDLQEAALEEAGDLLLPIKEGKFSRDQIRGSLGEVILGSKAGRTSDEDITLFKSVGLGIQDCAAASLAYKNAIKSGVGKHFELS
jgi:alanine dehydrogenase